MKLTRETTEATTPARATSTAGGLSAPPQPVAHDIASKPADLRGRTIACTGRLATMNRRELADAFRRLEIAPVEEVTRRTALLVVGQMGLPLRSDGALNHKLQQALRLRHSGGAIRIISEREFLRLAGLHDLAADLDRPQRAEAVCRRLGVTAESLAHWVRLKLLSTHDDGFLPRDVVTLRVLMGLVARSVEQRVLRASLERLRTLLPDFAPALQQFDQLARHTDDVLADLDDCRTAPDGQLMLGFAPQLEDEPVVISFARSARADREAHFAADREAHFAAGREADAPAPHHAWSDGGRSLPLPARNHPDRTMSADECFERGRILEEREQYDQAAQAYRAALALDGRFPEAFFNLGNVLRALGKPEAAAEMYRLALAQDPALACAWYNLADLAEEAGRLEEAIGHLRRALQVSPNYADAHFNLAHCLEAAGRKPEANQHWAAYLRHDPQSEWATLARRRQSAMKPNR